MYVGSFVYSKYININLSFTPNNMHLIRILVVFPIIIKKIILSKSVSAN